MKTTDIKTTKHCELKDITHLISEYAVKEQIESGVITVFVPHTTAGITINESGDPDVVRDILFGLERMVPNTGFAHFEKNSDAHLKTSLMGNSVSVIVNAGSLCLGTWQRIYFCEFDGPRQRKLWIKHV